MPTDIFIVTAVVSVIGLILAVSTATFKGGQWVGAVNEHKSTTVNFMKEIRDKLDLIFDRLPASGTMSSGSPLRLNDLGRRISDTLDLTEWVQATAAQIKDQVAGKSAYDIQQFCFDYVRNKLELDAEQDAKIKSCAFENGLTLASVRDVLAIELRDVLLGDKEPPE